LVAGQAEIAFIDDIQRHATTPLTCLRQNFSLPQLGALLSTFDLLLCHDSGPMHLAAAVGTRVVALYGSQDRSVFAPIGADHICLSPPLPCTNCVLPDLCKADDSYRTYCVRNIREEDVLRAIQQQLRTDATV
jgi:ADP-heptose:LPS heptosyltransferase